MQVLVAGGGPAGAICARTLARAGIRTVLIEASPDSDKPCAGGLPSVLFEHYKIPDLLVKQRATGVLFQAPSGYSVEARFPEGEYIATVNRREFDSHLRWFAEDAGAIQVRGRVLGYEEKSSQLLVKYRGEEGNVRTTEADYLIGADGAWSRIAYKTMGRRLAMVVAMQELIELPQDRMDVLGGNCIFNYSPQVSPDYYGWIFPKGNHVSVGVGTRLENKGRLEEFLGKMKEINSEVLQGGKTISRNGAMIPSGHYKEHGRHRILLAGDAAGMVLPACGEGIFYAMRSGEIAARVIAQLGTSRPDIVVPRYTDLVNAEFSRIFRYFDKVERAVYDSVINREVFVRLASDRFMARKILSAFSTKTPKSTPIFRKFVVSLKLIGIRLKVAMMPREKLDSGASNK